MAFAGYSSFASSDLPSTLLSALCPERLLFMHCISDYVMSSSCLWSMGRSAGHLRSERQTEVRSFSPGFFCLFDLLLSVTAFMCLRPYLWLHGQPFYSTALFEFWDSFLLFTPSAYGWIAFFFLVRFKVFQVFILISLNSALPFVNKPFSKYFSN